MHTFTWDFDRVLVYLPIFQMPIYWYGLFFALGAFLAQKNFEKNAFKELGLDQKKAQNGVFLFILAIVFGARVFDIIFYQDPKSYLQSPFEIFNLRQGGLSSHGGFIGFILALIYFVKKERLCFYKTLSSLIAPTGILAGFIRIGNMFNQEILGKAASSFLSIVFTHPIDGSAVIPRHPVKAYEALVYFLGFILFRNPSLQPKKQVFWALIYFFGLRFFLEFLKQEQSVVVENSLLSMGQILSLPIIIFAIGGLILTKVRNTGNLNQSL